MIFRSNRRQSDERILDEAVSCWKQRDFKEVLSHGARHRILRETIESRTSRAPRRSTAWRILAGALPVAAIWLLGVVLVDRSGGGDRPVRIRAAKTGGEVIFSIANGKTGHSVYKSNSASSFAASDRLPVHGGAFRDTVGDEAGLVVYRIE